MGLSQGHEDTDVGEGEVAARRGKGTATAPVLTVGFVLGTWGTPKGPVQTQFQWKPSAGFPSVDQMEKDSCCSEQHEHVGKILGSVLKQGKQAVMKP